MSETSDTHDAVIAGIDMAAIGSRTGEITLAGESVPVHLVNDNQRIEVPREALDLLDARALAPRRRTGLAHLDEIDSFVGHVNRFKGPTTAVFADARARLLLAIYDYHPGGADVSKAAWCQHRAGYTCPLSERWQAWTSISGELHSLDTFGEWIEDRFDDLVGGKQHPPPHDILALARNFELITNGTYKRRRDPRTGDFSLTSTQSTDESQSTTVPRAFLIAIPVFEGDKLLREVEARIKIKVTDGKPSIGFDLHRVREHVREAFADVRGAVEKACDVPVLAGTPEA